MSWHTVNDESKVDDYIFIKDLTDKERLAIRIQSGKFVDTVFAFDKLEFFEDVGNRPHIKFDLDVLTLPPNNKRLARNLRKRKNPDWSEFESVATWILDDILEASLEEENDDNEERQ